MKKLEETEHSQGNFICGDCPGDAAGRRFFGRVSHRLRTSFAIALESANVVAAAFKDAPDLAAARQRLTDLLAARLRHRAAHAGRVDQDTG